MSKPEPCPTCGGPLSNERPHSALIVVSKDAAVDAEQRMFTGTCPVCGPRLGQRRHMGHHSTQIEAAMKKVFPKRVRLKVKEALDKTGRDFFDEALHGKAYPSVNDVQRWYSLAADGSEEGDLQAFRSLLRLVPPAPQLRSPI